MKTTRWIVAFVFVSVLSLGIYRYFFFSPETASVENISLVVDDSKTTKEVVPFEDLTIPYLRSRTYDSILDEKTVYKKTGSYTSYLTSYASDGLKINGLLTIPNGKVPEGGWPAVVFVHGYIPPTMYKTTVNYSSYVDAVAKSGVVVFKIDLRGHGESEGEASGAYYSSDYVVDTLNAYRALQNLDGVNKGNVGLWGHSMAGNILFRAAAVEKTIPKVIIWAGAVYSYADFAKYGINDTSYRPSSMTTQNQRRRQMLFDTYGQFNETSEFWKKVSGVNYLVGVQTKFQIHHAADDNVVSVGYSRDFRNVLSESGLKVDYFEYKTGGHNLFGSSFDLAISRTVKDLKGN